VLEFEGSTFRSFKPVLRGETAFDGRITVRYTLSGPQARVAPTSITWQRENGQWVVYYDPTLDAEMRSWSMAQLQEGQSTAKLSTRMASLALRAAELQSHYIAVQLDGGHG
jgi:hypothetical protein